MPIVCREALAGCQDQSSTGSSQQAEYTSHTSIAAPAIGSRHLEPSSVQRVPPQTVALENSENYPPADANDLAAKPCTAAEGKAQVRSLDRNTLGLQQMDSDLAAPAASSRAHIAGENSHTQ